MTSNAQEKKPMSEAQRKTRNKWDLKNMSTLACRVYWHSAVCFRIYAESRNTNVNTLLMNYALDCIGEKERENSAAPAQKKPKAKEAAKKERPDDSYTTLGCRLRREQADRFREYAALRGRTVNSLLNDYIHFCIRENWEEIAARLPDAEN